MDYRDPNTLRRLYHMEGMSLREIGAELDCGEATVRVWMDKHGIERRSRGEARRLQNQHKVTITEVDRGFPSRHRLEFREFGEHRQFALSRINALVKYDLREMSGREIHHKNGCSIDDRPDNLELIESTDHRKLHAPEEGPPVYSADRRRELANQRDRDERGRFTKSRK